ncbi:hypothetical protein P8610_13380 [Fictibacillus sp. UD]|uniref:hypothetical protein n=1 Tax=Fictibacillus sp. UD TaxID=3038777 RepID=UPI003746F894
MNKEDVQHLFNEIKTNKSKSSTKVKTLFTKQAKKGCSSCGKVKWKPNKNK